MNYRRNYLTKLQGLIYLFLTFLAITGTVTIPAFRVSLTSSALAQTQSDRKAEADRLLEQGVYKYQVGQYLAAVDFYQKALVIYQKLGDLLRQGTVLNNLGEMYRILGNYSKALDYYQQALEIRQSLKDRSGSSLILNNIGSVYWNTGEYSKGLYYYQQALMMADSLRIKGSILNNIGSVYWNTGEYSKALNYYQEALVIRRSLSVKDRDGEGITLINIGAVYGSMGDYPKALDYYQQALVIMQEVHNRIGEGAVLNNIGAIYNSKSQYIKASDYYEKALIVRQAISDRAGEATTLNNMGETYSNQGQYAKGLDYYKKALSIRKEIGDHQGEGVTLHHLGLLYDNLGQDTKALDYYKEALSIREEIGDRQGQATTLNNMGEIYNSQQQYQQALDYYQKALYLVKEIRDRAGESTILNNLGAFYWYGRQYPKALDYYQQALMISKEIDDRAGQSTTIANIAGIYHSQQQYPEALDYYQKALAINKEIGVPVGEASTLNNIGVLFWETKKYEMSEQYFLDSIKVSESLRTGLKDTDKISIFDTNAYSYRLLQQALIFQEKTNQALEIAERGRSRALVELLMARISTQEKQQLPIFSPNIQQIREIAKRQNATLIEYSLIDSSTIDDQRKKKASELFIWVVKPTGEVNFRSVDLKPILWQSNISLEDLVAASRVSFGVRGRSPSISIETVTIDENESKKSLKQLHKILIEPIADLLPTDPNDHVIFMPQGELFLVPFPALQDKDGKYLIEKHTILTAPAIQVLDLTQKQRAKVQKANVKGLVIVGNPTMPTVIEKFGDPPVQLQKLPSAETEAIAIAKLLHTKALIGNQATKTAILSQLSQAKIIHLATHGLLEDFQSLEIHGVIALAPSGNDNGLLTASEILDLKLNAELVVLSACDTGRGRITGDGVIGLSRSLITAGVPSVIVSLWSVPDAPTAELMTEFYQNWQEKKLDKAQALRQAMLTTMKNHSNPKDWAAFTLIGEAN